MKQKPIFMSSSAEELCRQMQDNYDRMLDSSKKWAEVLAFDPYPQTGLSPREMIWRKNKAKLYRYLSSKDLKHQTPALFIYALINKAYILDLTPGMSMIEHLVNEGYDVYLLEWGDFGWEDRNLGFADFVFDYIAGAVRKVCQFSGTGQISMIGYCMGGTMACMYASLFPFPMVKNLVLLASPIDFTDAGLSSLLLKPESFDVDKIADTFQLMPKAFIDCSLKMLNPVNNFVGTYTRLWKMIDEGMSVNSWRVLNKWMNDNINLPGEAYRQWVKDMYQENKLIRKELVLRGRKIDLGSIGSALLAISGTNDHIVRPQQVQAALKAASSQDKTYVDFPVGHGGLVFGSVAKKSVYPALSEWMSTRSQS